MTDPIVFILSWERPLYLWACLDSLYRNTDVPCRFVLIDNASADPLVHRVIDAFAARGLFYRVQRRADNSPHALAQAIEGHVGELGDHFAVIDSDVIVLPSRPSWLAQFLDLARASPDLAMLGSLVDRSDFIDPEWAARRFPQMEEGERDFLIKAQSPERGLKDNYDEKLIAPFNPPGRLLLLRTDLIRRTGVLRDRLLYEAARRLGYRGAIATGVRHRHLSFQNIFDYPDLDIQRRHDFFSALEGTTPD